MPQVPKAIDTNGAGDTFATVYMLAAMRGDPSPGSTASWAASRAVLQPQTCKPRCAPQLITAPGGVPVLGPLERAWIAAVPLLQHIAGVAVGPVKQVADLAAQVPLLQEVVQQLEQFSQSSSWGRDVSSRLDSSAGVHRAAGAWTESRQAGAAADDTGRVAAAATAVPHPSRAGVEQH